MADEPVIFSIFVEAVFARGLGGKLSSERRERAKKLGVDFNRLAPAYPKAVFQPLLQIAAEEMAGSSQLTEQHFRDVGRRQVQAVVETKLGFALLGIARVVGPRRTLLRLDRNLRAGDNFTQAKVEELTPSSFRIHVNDVVGQPTYYLGALEAMVELCGGKNITAGVEAHTPPGATYRVSWS